MLTFLEFGGHFPSDISMGDSEVLICPTNNNLILPFRSYGIFLFIKLDAPLLCAYNLIIVS